MMSPLVSEYSCGRFSSVSSATFGMYNFPGCSWTSLLFRPSNWVPRITPSTWLVMSGMSAVFSFQENEIFVYIILSIQRPQCCLVFRWFVGSLKGMVTNGRNDLCVGTRKWRLIRWVGNCRSGLWVPRSDCQGNRCQRSIKYNSYNKVTSCLNNLVY